MKLKISLENFPDNIYILFNDKFRNKFFKTAWKINKSYRHLAKKMGVSNPTMLSWRRGSKNKKDQYCPMWVIKKIMEICKNSKEWKIKYKNIEKNIKSIKAKAGKHKIINPKLPIKDSIELRKIITHIICDGYDGHKPKATPKYELTEIGPVEEFKKALRIFGEQPRLEIKQRIKRAPYKNSYQLIFSKAISKILINKFKIDFEGKYARIPKELFLGKREYLIAVVRAFLTDEGSINDRTINFCSGNSLLLKDLKIICKKLGYKCYKIYKGQSAYYLEISPNSFEKVYKDLKKLGNIRIKEKQERLELGIKILKTNQDFSRLNSFIIKELKEESLTAMELSKKLIVNRKTIRERLNKLESNRLVNRILENGENIWSLN